MVTKRPQRLTETCVQYASRPLSRHGAQVHDGQYFSVPGSRNLQHPGERRGAALRLHHCT